MHAYHGRIADGRAADGGDRYARLHPAGGHRSGADAHPGQNPAGGRSGSLWRVSSVFSDHHKRNVGMKTVRGGRQGASV